MQSKRFLSAYFTLPPVALAKAAIHATEHSSWKEYFPFNDPSGAWTFSGRVALYAGLVRLGVPERSTILVPSYFQGTEIDTLLAAGMNLRFYRVDDEFAVDLADVEAKMDESVTALYVIHYFGLGQKLAPLEAFCRSKGILLIEDCALSLFSKDGDTWLGSRGDISLFSVYKTVPLPHGGYVVTKNGRGPDSDKLRKPPFVSTALQSGDLVAQHVAGAAASSVLHKAWNLTTSLRRKVAGKTVVSGTITLDKKSLELGAAPIVPTLMNLVNPEKVIARRRENFTHLHARLSHLSIFKFDRLADGACPLFYPIVVEDKVKFREELAAKGIGSVNLWSQPHPACPPEVTEQTATWRRTILELPIHQQIEPHDIDRIADEVLVLAKRRNIVSISSAASLNRGGPKGTVRPAAAGR